MGLQVGPRLNRQVHVAAGFSVNSPALLHGVVDGVVPGEATVSGLPDLRACRRHMLLPVRRDRAPRETHYGLDSMEVRMGNFPVSREMRRRFEMRNKDAGSRATVQDGELTFTIPTKWPCQNKGIAKLW